MRSPENLLSQVLTASPVIIDRAARTRQFIPETDPYINNIGALTGRAVSLTVRFGTPLGGDSRINITPWIPVGNMELAIREVSSGGIADHAQVIVRGNEQREEEVLLDLKRETISDISGKSVPYVDARTVVDHLQEGFANRKAA